MATTHHGRLTQLDRKDLEYVLHALRELPRRTQFRVLRRGLNAWGGQVRDIARIVAPKETKLLSRSFGVKVKIPDASYNPKHHGKPAYVIVGPKRNFVGPAIYRKGRIRKVGIKTAVKAVLRGQRVYTRKPARYAHLANKHTDYMKTAEQAGKRLGQTVLLHQIDKGVTQEAAKLAAAQP